MSATHGVPAGATVAIVGGGLGGALCALHLMAARPDVRIRIVERASRLGPGLAYGACAPEHLLNVPVSRLAIGLEPSFETWLVARGIDDTLVEALAESAGRLGDAFVPRAMFGDYVESLVAAHTAHGSLDWVRGEAVAFLDEPRRGVLLLDGREIEADAVVLALGNLPPRSPARPDTRFEDLPEYIADPWAPGAISGIAPDAPVLLIGTGLTMVDIVLALRARGHRGGCLAISRRGLLPQRHVYGGQWSPFVAPLLPASPSKLTRAVRRELKRAQGEDVPWQRVIDAIRPTIARVWQGWSSGDRKRFLRHLRPYWDVVRHRMAPRIARRIDELIANGQLTISSARITGHRHSGQQVEVGLIDRHGADRTVSIRHILNCTGPRSDFATIGLPLIRDARRRRLIRPDALGLGIETDACSVLDTEGAPSAWLFAVGSLTRPAWWEITAAPEINAQALDLSTSFAASRGAASLADRFLDLGAGI